MVKSPEHPLAYRNGWVQEHRMVLYDAIGPDPHPCHWCGTILEWSMTPRHGVLGKRGLLFTDHLDNNRRNNVIGNLVPACTSCNVRRSKLGIEPAVPFVVVCGQRRAAEPRVCENCGADYLYVLTRHRKPSQGRFCSRSCTATARHREGTFPGGKGQPFVTGHPFGSH